MKALVTGGAGFVGRHVVPMLEAAGYETIVVDPAYRYQASAGWCMNFEDWIRWKDREKDFDVVVHLAAHIAPVDMRFKGGLYNYQDIALDWEMAKWIEEFPPSKAFIYMSSCAIDNPDDPYAWVKLTGERIFGKIFDFGLPLVILRPFSGYGVDQAETYPFRAILERVVRGDDPVTVWGDGLQIRDWIHVDDLARAIMWAIDAAPRGQAIDIGTGQGTTIAALAAKMIETAFPGREINLYFDSDKPESGKVRIADTTIAKSYGFSAKISLKDGIRGAIDERLERNVQR